MGIPSQIKLAVVSIFKKAAEGDLRRFQNMAEFLGINPGVKKETAPATATPTITKEQSKDASLELDARSKGKVREAVRDWFLDLMKENLPVGYFEKNKRDAFGMRDRIFQYLPDDLFNLMQQKIFEEVGDKAKKQGYKGFDPKDLVLDEEVVDSKVIDMLHFFQEKPAELKAAINAAFAPKKKETTDKRFEPGPGEMWFTPVVSEALYEKYSQYVTKNRSRYEEKAQKEGKDVVVSPENLGIYKNKADPEVIKLLNKIKRFHIQIEDSDISTDSKEGLPTVTIIFFIPELAKERPEIYDDILFTKKLPANMGALRANRPHPASVQFSGERGLGIRFDDVAKAWQDNTSEVFSKIGFSDYESYRKFVNVLTREYAKEELRKAKNLDELIAELGGSIAIRNKEDPEGNVVNVSTGRRFGISF